MVNPWKTYVKLSAVLMGSHGLTKGSLAFLNYPPQLMFKSTKKVRNLISINEELKKKVEEQGMNMRDTERMKRELQSVERLEMLRLKGTNGRKNRLTPAEVVGIDYKSRLKPVLIIAGDEVKRTSMENYESLMTLQQLSRDIGVKINAKRNRLGVLQSRIEDVETQVNLIKNKT